MDTIESLRRQAREIGLFLPLAEGDAQTAALQQTAALHGRTLKNRAALLMQPVFDADENGAPTAETVARYCSAVRQRAYGILWTEPIAVLPDARADAHQLMLTEENKDAFQAMLQAVAQAAEEAHGFSPVPVALLGHAGSYALRPVTVEPHPYLPKRFTVLTDDDLTGLVVSCGEAAARAEQAGFAGVALNACNSELFGESLAAFHRDGRFGGDFDDRTRFLRDCYTAMYMTVEQAFLTIRLSLSDGIPQPDGWGMGCEDPSAPDLDEPALLLEILRQLFGVELVSCTVGIDGLNWMNADEEEQEIIRISRLCTCIAMADSDLQQNVQLILPEKTGQAVPFESLAAGMIGGEFASFAGYAG